MNVLVTLFIYDQSIFLEESYVTYVVYDSLNILVTGKVKAKNNIGILFKNLLKTSVIVWSDGKNDKVGDLILSSIVDDVLSLSVNVLDEISCQIAFPHSRLCGNKN